MAESNQDDGSKPQSMFNRFFPKKPEFDRSDLIRRNMGPEPQPFTDAFNAIRGKKSVDGGKKRRTRCSRRRKPFKSRSNHRRIRKKSQ